MADRVAPAHAVFIVLFASVAVFAVTGDARFALGAEVVAFAMMAAGAVTRRRQRGAWCLLTLSVGAWVAGDLAGGFGPLYLASYALAHPALVWLLCGQAPRPWRAWLALDGVLAGFTAAALLTGFVADALTGPGVTVPATTLAGDALLVTTIALAFALSGWRPGRAWWVLMAAEVLIVVTDFAVIGTVVPSHAALTAWTLALVLICFSAYQPPPSGEVRPGGWASAVVPVGGALISLGLLVHAALTGGRPLTVWLACGALVVGLVRALLLLAENLELLRDARAEAVTDKLTGLPNRRALAVDLARAAAGGRSHTLAFFDLDGFKEYNDAFGHAAGDALLQRLAPALAAVAGEGYRLGGDEFCLLVEGVLDDDGPLIARAAEALSEHGDGFSITSSFGLVVIPDEATDAADALRLADERMYARKRRRRAGHRGQARDVLVQVMAEQDGGLGEHHSGVAALAGRVGRRLGLDAEALDVLVRAAELHDVGKVAIPDSILHKPGPLDAAEWAIMRQHTVAGERILAAAPSMRPVARLVRASHERWDGGGYPDALAGEAIPLGARIVCACDAFDAMLSRRSYKEPMARGDALAELRRCSGTQFDPRVVEVVAEVAANLDTLVSG